MDERQKQQRHYIVPALFFGLGAVLLGWGGGTLIYGIAKSAMSDLFVLVTSVGFLMLSVVAFFLFWQLLPGNVAKRKAQR